MTQRQHVIPLDDLREHSTSSPDCWCKPTVSLDDLVVQHNSMDGRERYQRGERKPS